MTNTKKITRNSIYATIAASVFLLTASCGLLPNEEAFMAVAGKVVYDKNFPSDAGEWGYYGEIAVDTHSYKTGDTVTVLGNAGGLYVYSYYIANWNTQKDGSGTAYKARDTFTMPMSKVTLYAIWKTGQAYRVTYYDYLADSGEVPVDGNDYLPGQTVTVLGNTGNLVRSDYTFHDWGGYTPGTTFKINSSQTLYASWQWDYGFNSHNLRSSGANGEAIPVTSIHTLIEP